MPYYVTDLACHMKGKFVLQKSTSDAGGELFKADYFMKLI